MTRRRTARLDWPVRAGDDEELSITFKDPAGGLLDVSGLTFSGSVKQSIEGAVLGSMTFETSQAVSGDIVVSLDSVTTAALPDQCIYDIQSVDAAGKVRTWLEGLVQVSRQVTH